MNEQQGKEQCFVALPQGTCRVYTASSGVRSPDVRISSLIKDTCVWVKKKKSVDG
jgi:hypothetical protein